ncbi:MAG: hypothetical protein HZA28_05830 [Candidatus Omnitrophica bacterium]|nr:hypothetical protein [Candidatus Omnitrophota bacterium]
MRFDKNFFIKQTFTPVELARYKKSAQRDLDIAHAAKEYEVVFHFAYMGLIKIGIYCLAREGHRVKSRPGHHQKIIESLGEILGSEDVLVVGEKMRKDRNLDFYSANAFGSPEESRDYLGFIEGLYKKL